MRLALLLPLLLMHATAAAGVIHGTVRVPAAPRAAAAVQAYAGRASSLPAPAREVRGRASDAIVSIAELPAGVDSLLPGPRERARLTQKDQSFQPRVVSIARGERVDFPNSDPIFHNVFSVSPARRFDLGKYPKPESRTVRFDKPGVVNVYCDIHADMAAWIVVLPNRAFARPDVSGRYRLPELPPGRYTLQWWHPDFPGGEREVVVDAAGEVPVDLEF